MTTSTTDLLKESLILPNSLWAETAIELFETKELVKNLESDVLIIGGGFTGLSAAIHLAEQGVKAIVLDASEPGWGASGRNNGQIIAGLKQDPDIIESIFPGELGRKLVDFSSKAPSIVFNLIKKYNINCSPVNKGWIQPAFTKKGEKAVLHRAKVWEVRGINTEVIEGRKLHDLLGTSKYHIGWIDPRGGCIQPFSFVRGLANAAHLLGVHIFCHSKVIHLINNGDVWIVKTQNGSVKAKSIIVATGAYAEDLVKKLNRSIVPVRTAQVATKIIPDFLRKSILPQGHVSSDTRELLTSFRLSPEGRLVMGGSGATAGLNHSKIVSYLHQSGHKLFGTKIKLEWEYAWSGYFAVTTDHLPHIHEPHKNMYISVGCNGRGIAISTSLGIELAKRVLGESAASLPIPVTDIKPIAFHEFRYLGVAAATFIKRFQDCIEN
ncbi:MULTISPECIES: FAD-binding oxidoreductase [unclassified Acinetobacter]|uniref:NAD(P)/FAD-dependent oxidoreductase n=1 Tax=unclassified Acinetobacter TaxID=196816 RepID=UPI0018A954F3|nr:MULTISPECIES: FAD-binding oxidoreductase [unclassified Acinetobacter]MBJ9955323.1 FAD-binding oxidoreductase [Acinetobacter baumannii]